MIRSLTSLISGLFGAAGIAARAFEAHGLAALSDMSAPRLNDFNAGTEILLFHALALLALSSRPIAESRFNLLTACALAIGTLLFAGPLLTFGLTGSRALVMLTPIGGVLMIAGWIAIAVCGALNLLRPPRETP